MKIKCDYCDSMIEETEKSCPHCGAPLSGVNRMAGEQPKTIDQLKEWYVEHNLPPEEVTRFFIGKNIKEPKAFGIYQDGHDFVVYKNKADGSRAVRYKGSDEAYAVNELYQRLKAEIADQKSRNGGSGSKKKDNSGLIIAGATIGLILFIGILVAIFDKSPSSGYYRYNGTDYYYQGSNWYYYDTYYDDWYETDSSDNISQYIDSSNDDEYMVSDHQGKSFEDSSWYDSGDDRSWDNDNSWDSGDTWDSGGTDWGSDW
ncbi:MAG: zinc ribbon domain-containing protein [Lachnospiraceae bacterium]|nr:zinc ribbon domain-containing protein [Lachnospiraceae bacterium]